MASASPYLDVGEGDETILLSPRGRSSTRASGSSSPVPGPPLHVLLALDPRGNGRSDRPELPEAYGPRITAGDMLAVLDATGTRDCVLMAHCGPAPGRAVRGRASRAGARAAVLRAGAAAHEVALFLGVRPRFTVLDALENLHRLDSEFLRELGVKHKSGVEIMAGSAQFERPGGRIRLPRGAVSPAARHYEYIIVDAGNRINACTIAALYPADTIFLVANPDVPSVRNAQRLVDRVRQLGVGGERIRILLNRAAEPYMIPPKQIETALGYPIHHTFPSDYKTVSTALNSGVPLALTATRNRGAVRQLHAPDHFARRRRRQGRRRQAQAGFSLSFSFLELGTRSHVRDHSRSQNGPNTSPTTGGARRRPATPRGRSTSS